jgi:DNA-binding beta-propeller fold protein YncE
MPWGVTVDGEDHIYVVDWRNDRIQKFNSDGKFLDSFGESGVDDGKFNRPSKIAVDSQGNMYVADWGNERVQVLDPNGTFIQKLRGQATLTKWTEDFFESNIDERDTRAIANLYPTLPEHLQNPHSESAQTEPYFWGLRSLIVDDSDRLYVLESRRHRFQIYQKTPTK